jgi:hypothetical protein
MKACKASSLSAILALGIATQTIAAPFNITFDLGQGDTGSGQIDILPDIHGNFFAASGYLTISSGAAAGNWSIYSAAGAATYPGYFTSPAGAYWYNNAFYPDGVNLQYPGVNTPLDSYGLLFTQGSNELNLWGNADGSFTLHGSINGYQNFSTPIFTEGGPGTPVIDIIPIPEFPSSALAAFSGLLFSVRRLAAKRRRE